MLHIYYKANHNSSLGLCENCHHLYTYAEKRLTHCPFANDKPTCTKCTVHCYNEEMRAQVREVMRFSGPRMAIFHPAMAARHLFKGIKKPPELTNYKKEKHKSL